MSAVAGGLDVLPQIQSLVSDRLQVVSYKWLSRKFLVSSNHAKMLLQEFVDKHGNELEVIYTVSGWLNKTPGTYHVRLASSVNLAAIKCEFEDNCSVQVYSVQACIPKDPAVLWSAEFVQAEELFNEPPSVSNCLRDNRFGSVFNSFVERTIDEKSSVIAFPQTKSPTGISMQLMTDPIQRHPLAHNSSAVSSGFQISKAAAGENTHEHAKESVAHGHNQEGLKEKKKTSSGTGGSLSNLWSRASARPKQDHQDKDARKEEPNIAGPANAQIFTEEAEHIGSSDDERHEINHKRGSNSLSGRKRKVVMDFSDDEEDEHMGIGSNLNFEEQKKIKDSDEDKNNEKGSSIKNEFSLQEKAPNHSGLWVDKKNDVKLCSNAPQGRQVLKKRIDERGREVTEVVWEGDAVHTANAKENAATNDSAKRPPLPSKPQATASAPSNAAPKGGNKKTNAKGGAKDAKQGNLLSFFKKA